MACFSQIGGLYQSHHHSIVKSNGLHPIDKVRSGSLTIAHWKSLLTYSMPMNLDDEQRSMAIIILNFDLRFVCVTGCVQFSIGPGVKMSLLPLHICVSLRYIKALWPRAFSTLVTDRISCRVLYCCMNLQARWVAVYLFINWKITMIDIIKYSEEIYIEWREYHQGHRHIGVSNSTYMYS